MTSSQIIAGKECATNAFSMGKIEHNLFLCLKRNRIVSQKFLMRESRYFNGLSREQKRWSRGHIGCVMANLKGDHKTLMSQFLYHIFTVHFERLNFLVSYNMQIKVLIYALICTYFLFSFHTFTDIRSRAALKLIIK